MSQLQDYEILASLYKTGNKEDGEIVVETTVFSGSRVEVLEALSYIVEALEEWHEVNKDAAREKEEGETEDYEERARVIKILHQRFLDLLDTSERSYKTQGYV